MIEEYLFKKIIDAAYGKAKKVLSESKTKLNVTRDDIEQSINHHLRAVKNWSEEISFNDLKKAKLTTNVYLELDLFLYPRRIRINPDEEIESVPLSSIFEESASHFIILGQPGAGKTTSMKYLCQLLFHNEDFHRERFSFPMFIKLRDLNNKKGISDLTIILDQIYGILGFRIELPKELLEDKAINERKALKEKLVVNFINELGVLLILDGFDELTQSEMREEVIKEITTLSASLDKSTVIVTSRTGDFKYNIDNTAPFEIRPLKEDQISKFALKWLGDESKASDFLAKISDSPFADTAIRPLTLAHLCAIYERIGKIPDKPKTTYRKIIDLLLEEWDQQRSVKRESRYAKFEVYRKVEFLCHLAYVLTTYLQKTVFSKQMLIQVYTRIYQDYDLRSNEAQQVVNELETHTGLLLQTGYEQFEFAHKSLQEFLTAEHIVKLPNIPSQSEIIKLLPNELAIAVTISSRPSDYFTELVVHRFTRPKVSEQFIRAFLSRLLLEKPDFNTSIQLGLSLLLLYSMYLDYHITNGTLATFHSDSVIIEFEKLIKSALRKSSIDIIQNYYEQDSINKIGKGDNITRLEKRKYLKKYDYPFVSTPINLPDKMYIKSSLFDEIMINNK